MPRGENPAARGNEKVRSGWNPARMPSMRRRITGLAALVVWALAAPVSVAQDAKLRFLSPRNLATALGETEIAVVITRPAGVEVLRLELVVDGAPLTTLTAPPWKAVWDAGDGSRGHRVVAVALLSDGSELRGVVNTSPLRINQVEEVDLVNLYVIVRSQGGRYVTDLERDDFRVLENGRPQRIQRFSSEGKPLRIAIVLDTSLSMRGSRLESAQKAALEFLDALRPEDEALVVTFDDEVRIPEQLTSDADMLAHDIRAVQATGGTALYDAVWRTSRRLGRLDGRKVMVLLSDGRDEAASGLEPGSLHTLDEALDQALRSDVMIFAIGLGRQLDLLDFYQRYTLESLLTRLASETGGRMIPLSRAGQLKRAFGDVALDLRHQYSIAYVSDDTTRDGKWRKVELTVPGQDYEVVTRKGYYSPEEARAGQFVGSR